MAVIGTTIAPWMQFYQQSAIADKHIAVAHLPYERIDTYVGAFLTDFVAFFIVVCTGATLFVHHIQINEAKDAALALGPLVGGNGRLASILFGIGLLNASIIYAIRRETTVCISAECGCEPVIPHSVKPKA